jgi:hypothetical protein
MSARPENGGTSGTSIAALVAAAEALVPKYDVAVPCDTSFPTAPDARDHFDAEDWAEALEESNDAARPLSIYVHLPFGRRLRLFCGCHPVVPRGRDPRTRYLEHLEREIDAVAERIDPSRRAVELHFGGGTPTFFSPKQLERLYVEIADHFRLDEAADIGVELDPRARRTPARCEPSAGSASIASRSESTTSIPRCSERSAGGRRSKRRATSSSAAARSDSPR